MFDEEIAQDYFREEEEENFSVVGTLDYQELIVIFNSLSLCFGGWDSTELTPSEFSSSEYDQCLKDALQFPSLYILALACPIPRREGELANE